MKQPYIIISLISFILGVMVFKMCGNNNGAGGKIHTDTVPFYDTIPYYKPVPKDSTVIKYVYIPVYDTLTHVNNGDTINQIDTVYASIPITQKHYQEENYEAWVSGYNPNLDSLNIFYQHLLITQKIQEKPSKFGVGVSVGVGVGKEGITPYVGISINYNLLPLRKKLKKER